MAKISAGAMMADAWSQFGPSWRGAPGPLALVVAVYAAAPFALAAAEARGLFLIAFVALQAPAQLANTLAMAAIYRRRLMADHPDDAGFRPGPAGLALGMLEARVLGGRLMIGVIIAGLLGALFGAIGVVLTVMHVPLAFDPAAFQQVLQGSQDAVAKLTKGPIAGLGDLLILIGCIASIYLLLRLTLLPAAWADTGRLDVNRAWALTHGATGGLFFATIMIVLAQLLASMAGGFIGGALAMVSGVGPHQGAEIWVQVFAGAVGAAVNLPLAANLAAYTYRTQRDAPKAQALR